MALGVKGKKFHIGRLENRKEADSKKASQEKNKWETKIQAATEAAKVVIMAVGESKIPKICIQYQDQAVQC